MISLTITKNDLDTLSEKIKEKYSLLQNKEKLNSLLEKHSYRLSKWEYALRKALSDPLPKALWKSLRDPKRLFPHKNTGKQLASFQTKTKVVSYTKKHLRVKSWAEIGVPYAISTNMGLPTRSDGIKPNWVGWATDTFFGTGRREVNSVVDVFSQMINDFKLSMRGL